MASRGNNRAARRRRATGAAAAAAVARRHSDWPQAPPGRSRQRSLWVGPARPRDALPPGRLDRRRDLRDAARRGRLCADALVHGQRGAGGPRNAPATPGTASGAQPEDVSSAPVRSAAGSPPRQGAARACSSGPCPVRRSGRRWATALPRPTRSVAPLPAAGALARVQPRGPPLLAAADRRPRHPRAAARSRGRPVSVPSDVPRQARSRPRRGRRRRETTRCSPASPRSRSSSCSVHPSPWATATSTPTIRPSARTAPWRSSAPTRTERHCSSTRATAPSPSPRWGPSAQGSDRRSRPAPPRSPSWCRAGLRLQRAATAREEQRDLCRRRRHAGACLGRGDALRGRVLAGTHPGGDQRPTLRI